MPRGETSPTNLFTAYQFLRKRIVQIMDRYRSIREPLARCFLLNYCVTIVRISVITKRKLHFSDNILLKHRWCRACASLLDKQERFFAIARFRIHSCFETNEEKIARVNGRFKYCLCRLKSIKLLIYPLFHLFVYHIAQYRL